MWFIAQTMNDFERIAGTFGVPVVILVAVFVFVIIPITKAQVSALNKVGEAIPPLLKDVNDLKNTSADQTDVLRSISSNQEKLSDNQEKLAGRLDTVCKVSAHDGWKPK
jgi:hypothetical protein